MAGRAWLRERVVPRYHEDKLGGTTGERDRLCNPGFQHREIQPQNHYMKTPVGVEGVAKTPSLTGEVVGETHRVLERTQTHPPRNQHQKGPICLWAAGEVTESRGELSKRHCSLSDPPPHTASQCGNAVGCPALGNT